MKLAMAQMRMTASMGENLAKTLSCIEYAGTAGADLILFPELQLSPLEQTAAARRARPWLDLSHGGPTGGV